MSVPSVSSLPVKLQGGLFVNVIALRVDDTSTMGPIDMKIKQRMKQIPSQPGRGTDIKSGLDMRVAYPSDIPFTDDGTPAVDDFSDIAEYGAKLRRERRRHIESSSQRMFSSTTSYGIMSVTMTL